MSLRTTAVLGFGLLGASVLTFAVSATEAAAQGFKAENRIIVTSTGGATFVAQRREGARGAWCAAADFAKKELGASGTQRIYVAADPLGTRNGVKFTLDPAGLTPSSVFSVGASIKNPGANLSVDHAFGFCSDFKLINRG